MKSLAVPIAIGVVCLAMLGGVILGGRSVPRPVTPVGPITTAAAVEPPLDHTGWHPSSATTEVKWFRQPFAGGSGGQCYARAVDGSTRDAAGKPGLVPVAEKFCVLFDAKDTPIGVPNS